MTSRQLPKPYVIYHEDCADGFGAAYACWKFFGDSARYIPSRWPNPPPQMKEGADVYIVDYSFSREELLELAKKHRKVVIIDHHASAMEALKGIEEEAENIRVEFDLEHSGAYLAWDYFKVARMPALIKHIEDRDLWAWKFAGTKEIIAALHSYPQDFEVWDKLMSQPTHLLLNEGAVLARQQKKYIDTLLRECRTAIIQGFTIPVVNAPYFLASELGHEILRKYPDAPFSGVYRDAGNGDQHWSLRSEDDRVNVMDIAVRLGGGGHRNASGFAVPAGTFHTLVSLISFSYDELQRWRDETAARTD